jgi:hypothetical protein
MKLSFKRISEGFYEVYRDNKLIARMQKNPNFNTFPWQIEKANGVQFTFKGFFDCFKFDAAKRSIRECIGEF